MPKDGAAVGDVNSDGFDDVAFTSWSREVRVVSGLDGVFCFSRQAHPSRKAWLSQTVETLPAIECLTLLFIARI